jgi:hypothetical protein
VRREKVGTIAHPFLNWRWLSSGVVLILCRGQFAHIDPCWLTIATVLLPAHDPSPRLLGLARICKYLAVSRKPVSGYRFRLN